MQTDRLIFKRTFDQAFNQGNMAIGDDLLSSAPLVKNAIGGALNRPGGLKLWWRRYEAHTRHGIRSAG